MGSAEAASASEPWGKGWSLATLPHPGPNYSENSGYGMTGSQPIFNMPEAPSQGEEPDCGNGSGNIITFSE